MPPSFLRRCVNAAVRQVWHRRELCIYSCSAHKIRELPESSLCRRDAWADLDFCDSWSYEHLTREQYLAEAGARRKAGKHHLYSLVEDGVLVHYGWLTYPQERAPDAALGLEFIPPPRSAGLWDYFTHPAARGRGLYLRTLRQCLHDALDIDGAESVFIYVYADNGVSRHVIEKAGFTYRGSLVLERFCGRTRRYATSAGDALEVRLLSSGSQAETRQDLVAMPTFKHGKEPGRVVDRRDHSSGDDQFPPGPPRPRPT